MSYSKGVRVGLIGCGNIGATGHAPAYARIDEARLVAVCDLIPERAYRVAESTESEPCTDYGEVLARSDIDMVDICLPTHLHAAIAIQSLQTGKHVLCEKPIAHNLADADAIIQTAKESGLKAMIAHVRRFDHRYIDIKTIIDSGEVGKPVYMRRAERQRLPFPPEAWFWDAEKGGGVIIDIGVHVADLFRWYFGQDPVSVFAIGRRVREAARQAKSYDHVFITYQFPDGAIGLAETSWAHPAKFGPLYASLDVLGNRGKVRYSDQDSNPMLIFDSDEDAEYPRYFRFMSTTEFAFEDEIRHFARCILEDRPPAISLEDARQALEMALAAQRSAETGLPVTFPFAETTE